MVEINPLHRDTGSILNPTCHNLPSTGFPRQPFIYQNALGGRMPGFFECPAWRQALYQTSETIEEKREKIIIWLWMNGFNCEDLWDNVDLNATMTVQIFCRTFGVETQSCRLNQFFLCILFFLFLIFLTTKICWYKKRNLWGYTSYVALIPTQIQEKWGDARGGQSLVYPEKKKKTRSVNIGSVCNILDWFS